MSREDIIKELADILKEVDAATEDGANMDDHAGFKKYLNESGYEHVRRLPDGTWIGIVPLLFTVGLCVGLDRYSWQKRYCYDDAARAITEIYRLESGDQVPAGWIAKRPQ